jgi:hypothetical protein
MSTQLYSQVYVLINGKLLMEHANVSVNRDSGAQVVTTVGRGFAGVSLGAPQLTISVDNAIPISGFEFDAGQHIQTLEVVEIGLLCAGLALSSKGFILKDSIKHAVNQESGYSFEFIGDFSEFE